MNDNTPLFDRESTEPYSIKFKEDLSDLETDKDTGFKIITSNIKATDKDRTSFEFGTDSIV